MRRQARHRSGRVALTAAAVAVLVFGQAQAQVGPGRDLRNDAHAQRQLRAVEGRSVTQPGAAALDAANARQQLLRGQRGRLSPDEGRVDRRLDALSTPAPRPTPVLPQAPSVGELPASFDDAPIFPGSSSASERVQNLIERAGDGIAEGRLDQARSDLGLAESQLRQLGPADGSAALSQQIATLRGRLNQR